MAIKLRMYNLLLTLSLVIFGIVVVNTGVHDEYESFDVVCGKCNCTKENAKDERKNEIFTVDCSMKNTVQIIANWPEWITANFKEIVYIVTFNNISKFPQFPSTEAILFLTLKHCRISKISENAFIDAKNIFSLDLSHNEILSDSLNPDIFRGPHSDAKYSAIFLQILDLSHNFIDYLDRKIFEHTPYLKKLNLSFNNLKTITDATLKALASCENLEVLHLEQVGISDLPLELFENMKNLSEITLNDNFFIEIPAALSKISPSLKVLYLNGNPIETIKVKAFEGFQKLEKLNINFMPSLQSIENGSFNHLKALKVLTCSGNKNLREIYGDDFFGLMKLHEIDFSNDSLISLNLETNTFENNLKNQTNYFTSLHTLKLAGNPWKCDCNLFRELSFFDHNSTYFVKAQKYDDARCASPFELLATPIYNLPFDYICAADQKTKPIKIPIYDPPQFLRPKSIMLTMGSVILVIVLGIILGILIVRITKRLKSNSNHESSPVRYSAVRDSTVSNVVRMNYQQP